MELNITNDVVRWYEKELSIESPTHIRFFPRYGYGGHIPGFSIGINHDPPEEMYVSNQIDNITFYIELKDAWYFEDMNLNIVINDTMEEPEFKVSIR